MGETEITEVVSPVLHKYDAAPEALSVVFSPLQIIVVPVTEEMGAGKHELSLLTKISPPPAEVRL